MTGLQLIPVLTRRRLLIGTASLGAAAALGACADDPENPAASQSPSVSVDRDVDVLVVGAGIAGLVAAHAVNRAGLRCAILEARDRVGGRIWTSDRWPDLPVDLGASWMHGTDGNPVFDEANRLGIESTAFDVGSFDGTGTSVLYSAQGRLLDDTEVNAQVTAVLRQLEDAADTPGSDETSVRAALDALSSPDRERARIPAVASGLITFVADYGATTEQLALSAVTEDDSYPGPQRIVPAGYGQLTRRMAETLPVSLNTPVTSISLRNPDRVVVESGGASWTARKVIVTVPLGVLKSRAIRFDPELPAGHQQAIDRLGFGRYEKLILRFDSVFWDDVDQIQIAEEAGAAFTGWYNLNRAAGKPALMALNGGAAAAAVTGLSVERQTAMAGELLSRIYPDRFRPPIAAQASDWWGDEFSRGSYSFTAVGSGEVDRKTLAEPVDDRLWLAGEAQDPVMHSTVHGAWASGQRAAEQACD